MKALLSVANVSQWTDYPSLVLFGIHSVVKADVGYTAAQLIYRGLLRLLGPVI